MKDRTHNYFTVSKRATRILREHRASPFVRALYADLVELEDLLLRRGEETFFFNYSPRAGNPPRGKKGHVISLVEWTGQSKRGLQNGLEFLAGLGLIKPDYHRPLNPKTRKRAKKRNKAVRIVD